MLENTGGAVRSNGDQQVAASGINNARGVFSSRDGITVASKQLDNDGGTLISRGAGIYRLDQLNNQHGKVHSGDALTLEGRRSITVVATGVNPWADTQGRDAR